MPRRVIEYTIVSWKLTVDSIIPLSSSYWRNNHTKNLRKMLQNLQLLKWCRPDCHSQLLQVIKAVITSVSQCHGICICPRLWRFGLVCNIVGRINEVNQRRARLVLGWVTVFKTGKPSLCVTSHPGQLSLAIPPRVGKMSAGDDYSHHQGRNGEFCITVGPVPACWHTDPVRYLADLGCMLA